MNITYDPSVDAAYISLSNTDSEKIKKTYPCDPSAIGGEINLDFNHQGKLSGIEILSASKFLSSELLARAEKI